MNLFRKIVLLLISSQLLTACGYYNPYVASNSSKPITLHRSMWANKTNELGLETTFYRSLSDWLRKSKLITLTESEDESDYELKGKIVSVDYPEISYASNRVANELRANLTVSYTLTEKTTEKVVWEKTNYTLTETLTKVSNPSELQANKKAALAEISDNLAEEIYLYIINSIMRPDRNKLLPIKMDTQIK